MNNAKTASDPLHFSTRGQEYAKQMAQRAAKQPKTKKYPIVGTDQSINLTQDQIQELVEYGDLYDQSGNRLVLDNNRLRLMKGNRADDLMTDILTSLADQGIDTTGVTRGK